MYQKASVKGRIVSRIFRIFTQGIVSKQMDKLGDTKIKHIDFNKYAAPTGYEKEVVSFEKFQAYLLCPIDSSEKRVIYHIHGGAYILPFTKSFYDTGKRYADIYHADLFAIDYRVVQDDCHPAALEDAVEGYMWLLERGYVPQNIIVCGDSAGGGLAIAMCMKLREMGVGLPKALILSSPWADLSASGESYKTKAYIDALFGTRKGKTPKKYPVDVKYVGNGSLTDPYLSPVYGDFSDMPAMLIQTGDAEVLLSDSDIVADKARQAGVEVEYLTYPGMYHTFYIITPNIPEGREAWKVVERFIKKQMENAVF